MLLRPLDSQIDLDTDCELVISLLDFFRSLDFWQTHWKKFKSNLFLSYPYLFDFFLFFFARTFLPCLVLFSFKTFLKVNVDFLQTTNFLLQPFSKHVKKNQCLLLNTLTNCRYYAFDFQLTRLYLNWWNYTTIHRTILTFLDHTRLSWTI